MYLLKSFFLLRSMNLNQRSTRDSDIEDDVHDEIESYQKLRIFSLERQ